ncbi:MAG: leucine-rich repeat domain-containing protein [Candidatus Kapaibacterium sp.]
MKKILFLFLFILVISSCKDDEGDIVAPGNEYTPKIITENYGTAKLVGFVNDKSGNPLSGVTVFFGEEKTLTGTDGGYQLNTLSSGSNKRIWFQKSGYASTQKLADIKEDLPNRIDASLFPIDKTEKMNSDGGKIEGKDFSLEIQPGGFVYSDGRPVEEDVFVEVTAFLTSEDEFLDAFPGEFRGTRENGTETAIESFGFIDVVLKVESGEPVQLADGVTATIKIKAPQNSPATIPMWHYDEDKGKWIEEGIGSLVDGFYIAEVKHFTKWNWDRPYNETSKIVGRVIDNAGNPIEGASVVQKGITYIFQNSAETDENGAFELLTPESNESEIEAYFDIYGSTIINYTTSPNKGQVYNIGDIKINVSIDNVIEPYISDALFYITIGQSAKITGKYFGEVKRNGYKLLLNGNEVETTTWQNDLIEFVVPNGIPEEGTIQIDRDGVFSREVNYKEGDWTCEIKGNIYDNNDQLTYLYLSNRILIYIPNCIGNLQNLKELHLSNNRLSSLPESFGNLRNLQELDLHYNDLTSLPKSFSNLQNLRLLDLHSNPLSSLPKSIGNLQNLRELDLSLTRINSLPENIVNLQNLVILNLENNDFVILSESIGNLQNLKTLNLELNDLTSLPESFGNLENLEELNLYKNELTTLPESFGNLQNLKELNLRTNRLSSLPISIKNLKENLILLILTNNNFSEEEKAKVEKWLPNTTIYW